MAQSKSTALLDSDNGVWKILRKDKNGDEKTTDTVPVIAHLDTLESVSIMQGLVEKAPKKRLACVSLLCDILTFRQADLQEWRGKGNRKTGQLANELKDEFRKAEDAFFGQFMSKDHPGHKAYVQRLPKLNERSEKLVGEDGEENPRTRHNYFVSSMRKDANYSNAKNLVLSYWSFVGQHPQDEETGNILPPEVMRVMVEQAKDVEPTDNSWPAKLQRLIRELLVPANPEEPVTIPDDRIAGLLQDSRALVGELERLATLAAQRATAKVRPGTSVPTQAGDMISRAQDAARVNMSGKDDGKVKDASPETAETPPAA